MAHRKSNGRLSTFCEECCKTYDRLNMDRQRVFDRRLGALTRTEIKKSATVSLPDLIDEYFDDYSNAMVSGYSGMADVYRKAASLALMEERERLDAAVRIYNWPRWLETRHKEA